MNAGTVFVLFGPVSEPVTDLGALGTGGIRIDGGLESSFTGDQVAGTGDFNGDGRDDVAMAGPHTDIDPLDENGTLYMVYGFGASLAYPGQIAAHVEESEPSLKSAVRSTGVAASTCAAAARGPRARPGDRRDPGHAADAGQADPAHRDDDRPHRRGDDDDRRRGGSGTASHPPQPSRR